MAKKKDTIVKRVVEIMNEAFFMPLFFVMGINVLKERAESISDKELAKMFGNLYSGSSIRKQIIRTHVRLDQENIRIS